MLINTAFLFLVKPEYPIAYRYGQTRKTWFLIDIKMYFDNYSYAKFTADLASVSRRILLEGPTGTELYQETLVRALAKHFKAQLLIVDNTLLEVCATGGSNVTEIGWTSPLFLHFY